MTMSDSVAVCATAIQGLGIALVSMTFAAGYLEAGGIADGIAGMKSR
ncbi:hypothetical protein PS922_00929 [Pseudomonas fluorescens]|uniref:Uncharacterized protein n=1 Tax=Pseudomonas fluorescens TaxID=294 RepID=A0A5E7RF06_PSEFL|nr:hypothetical protein PS922_00929 [Pseudomonas fluorescens]